MSRVYILGTPQTRKHCVLFVSHRQGQHLRVFAASSLWSDRWSCFLPVCLRVSRDADLVAWAPLPGASAGRRHGCAVGRTAAVNLQSFMRLCRGHKVRRRYPRGRDPVRCRCVGLRHGHGLDPSHRARSESRIFYPTYISDRATSFWSWTPGSTYRALRWRACLSCGMLRCAERLAQR